jgi:hypothetical protein
MKTLIITPAYTQVHEQTRLAVQDSGLPWSHLDGHSDLPRVRSLLIGNALGAGAERIIFLDADVVPKAEDLVWLSETEDVTPDRAVWGVYCLKDGRLSIEPKSESEFDAAKPGQLVPIDWGGLGIACVHSESLRRVQKNMEAAGAAPVREKNSAGEPVGWTPFCCPFIRGGEYYADDRSLCARLAKAGVGLVCRPDLRSGHMAERMLTVP